MQFILDYYNYIDNIENLTDRDNYIYEEINKRTKFGRLALFEGLIFTHPLNKSVVILKRRFDELNIEIEEDGEIYIEGDLSELSKYLPMFTNLGYFISKYTTDGTNWEIDYTKHTKPIALYLEPKYDYLIDNIPDILYHASPLKFKNKILKYGLSPRSGNKLSKHPKRIYLTNSINNAYNFGLYLQDNNKYYDDGFCIYSINGKSISKLYSDINFKQGVFYIMNNIDLKYIKLEKEFKK